MGPIYYSNTHRFISKDDQGNKAEWTRKAENKMEEFLAAGKAVNGRFWLLHGAEEICDLIGGMHISGVESSDIWRILGGSFYWAFKKWVSQSPTMQVN